MSFQIVEVCPESTKDLPPGTRLCAYWSQQYRCLYPGTSVEPTEPDPELDVKFVSVEFDDGDSGRIALEDIRYLHPDYPVVGRNINLLHIFFRIHIPTFINVVLQFNNTMYD